MICTRSIAVGDQSLGADTAINHFGRIIRMSRQGYEMWSLLDEAIDGPLIGFAMDPHISDFFQPRGGHIVEMCKRMERTCIE